jgi:asparagine synthase (glutamine-hydrolysing)
VLALDPDLDPGFVAARAPPGGRLGYGDRTATMSAIFGGLVPDELLRRESKASGREVFWRGESRRFAERWDGGGVDPELVDPEAVRRQWLAPEPDGRTALLLQSSWLASEGRGSSRAPEPGASRSRDGR